MYSVSISLGHRFYPLPPPEGVQEPPAELNQFFFWFSERRWWGFVAVRE
jgi:hypothetical protein